MSYLTHAIDQSPTIRGEAAATIASPAMLAVKFDSNGKLAIPSAGDFCIGITLADSEAVAAGDTLNVQIKDICYWISSGSITKGAMLKTDANGKAAAAGAGDAVLAIALEAGSADKPMKVLINHTTVPATAASLALKLDDLTDVDLTTPATDGQILKYVAADSVFKAAADS